MVIPTADLVPIRELYARGMYIQALRIAERFGPLHEWSNTPARLLGGRLAIQLGAARLGRWLHLRAYRDTPAHPEAIYYHARYRLERFGPLAAWRFLRSHPDQDWNDASPEVRSDWYGLHAFVCGRLRDFDRAERWLAKAETLARDRAWLCVERAAILEFAERPEDALAAARQATALIPFFRPGVQAEAHLLQALGREHEALALLEEASVKIESSIVVAHLAALQFDLRLYADARRSYERYADLSPLRDADTEEWLAARRADVAYYLGELPTAREQAVKANDDFYKSFSSQLADLSTAPVVVRLDVPRPINRPGSVLDLTAAYWKMPAQEAPVELNAADGLHDVRERKWAEDNGFVAVEFTVTPTAIFALHERGIPFLITLVDAGYSHAQLAVGSDRGRRSVWLTDIADRRPSEVPLTLLDERYSSTGPRGLVLIPQVEARRLEGVVLADRDAYDRLHLIQAALHRHDRAAAVSAYETMKAADTGHRLTRLARLALARYDGNPTLLLHAVDALLALFPDDNTLLLTRLNTLRDLGRKDERTETARRQLARRDADPLFAHQYAQALVSDPDRLDEAASLMRRAVRQRPYAPAGYYILGNVLWEQRRFQEATDLYRFAASLEDRDEQFAEAYFRAARAVEQTPEAMRFLKARYERTRGKIAGPARAMFYALSEEDEVESAFDALAACWAAPPTGSHGRNPHEVGEVMLFAAEMRTNYNEPTAGQKLLDDARPLATRAAWLRSSARQALVRADLPEARRCWDELLREDPLAGDIHRNMSRAVADLEGRAAAIEWVRGQCERFPFHYPLHQLLIDWLRGEQVADLEASPAEPVIRHLIDLCPDDGWARRELALHLSNHGRAAEAFPELEVAQRLEPESPSYYYTLGHALNRDDRPKEARAVYEEAVRKSVDNEVAIGELFALARTDAEKKEVIEFVVDELRRQHVFGDGLLAFREQAVQAHDAVEPDELMRLLQDIFDEHPDLWQTWSVVIQQLTLVGRVEEARELAKEAVECYPLLARLWVDLAEVCHAQEDRDGQIRALRQSVHVAPGWSYAARELADAMEENHEVEEARVILEQAVARSPLDPVNHGYLADNLWSAAEQADPTEPDDQTAPRREAIERLRIALRIDPGYDWAWRHLNMWAERINEPERAIEIAREVCRLRPGDPRGWLALARMLHGPESHEEALTALNRAIALNPRGLEAYDLKAERLADMGRYDEAKAAATPAVFDHDPPMILQGRAAWVEARRGNLPLACREMQALVTLEPNYYWGWQQLAEWYNESGRPAEFLEATEKLVELRPDNPIALAMRGEARIQNNDREGGKEDLRDAQHLEPSYSYPGMLLFDAHLQDEEYQPARGVLAVLEEHIGAGGRPYVLARYAQLAARTEDPEGAAEAFAELLTLPCDSTWPISSSATELREAGWGQRVDQILRDTLKNAADFHPWVLMAWLESKDGTDADAQTRLTVVKRVTEIHPRYAQAFDVLAELYARLGRFDEAMRACHPKAWEDRPPLILRGRLAWIMWQRGDHASAIARMREIVGTDPDYYWGWQQLANWYDEEDAAPEYLEATEHLVRLGPSDPSAFGYRGEARAAAGDRRGAKADFRRAFELDPAYAFAGISFFDSQMTDGELDEAERTLARLEEHVGGPHVQFRTIRMRTARRDVEGARLAFEGLLRHADAPPFVVTKAAATMSEAGFDDAADEVIDAAIERGPSATIARLFVDRRVARGDWTIFDRLPSILKGDPSGREVLYAAIDALGSPKHRVRLHDLLNRFGDAIRETIRGWAKAAAALVAIRDFAAAATWVADWRTRKPDEPWMIHPAAVAFRQLGRIDEARRVVTYALDLEADDPTAIDFHVWLAFEEAIAGQTDRANELLADIDEDDLDDVPRILLALTQTLLLVQSKGRAAFADARARGEAVVRELSSREPDADLKLSYRRWAKRLARDAGGFAAWLWAKWNGNTLPRR
ncbi:MAG TPA: tetratricopeptide repeat protein [Gemmataceae bacterium]|jgi:tetratricopeptide (TPR) repeat protein|nr:tetratricopeptide repeat protein [Gemmataceae bacterium]